MSMSVPGTSVNAASAFSGRCGHGAPAQPASGSGQAVSASFGTTTPSAGPAGEHTQTQSPCPSHGSGQSARPPTHSATGCRLEYACATTGSRPRACAVDYAIAGTGAFERTPSFHEASMSRILFCVVPEKGHLNPCIGPAQYLQAAGHEVAFYAPADISAQLALAGNFSFLGPKNTPEQHDLSRGAYFAEKIQDANWLRHWIRQLLLDATPGMIPDLRNAMRQWQADIIV